MASKKIEDKVFTIGEDGRIDDDTGQTNELPDGLKAKVAKKQEEFQKRVDLGETFVCAVCGKSEYETKDDIATISEAEHDYTISYCESCAAGMAAALLLSLPPSYQHRVVDRFVLSAGRSASDIREGIAFDMTTLFVALYPDKLKKMDDVPEA